MRLNNLNSFTDDFERAWEFGSKVLQAQVPLTKVFFMGGLLPRSLFKGESEVLVIGGEYEVKVLIGG
jgi:NAD+--dinitrogen-reductase ADP-D-ribosyltransferase